MEKDALLAIARPQKLCQNCNSPIDSIDRHPSILKARKRDYERFDYCPECWGLIKDDAYDSFWLTKRVVRERRVKLNRRQRNAALRALFESLWERRETEDVGPHLFFLAHLLMKWGGLRWQASQVDAAGNEIIVFEDPASGEAIQVPGITIDDERMALIKLEVEDFLRQYAPEDQVEL